MFVRNKIEIKFSIDEEEEQKIFPKLALSLSLSLGSLVSDKCSSIAIIKKIIIFTKKIEYILSYLLFE